MITNCSVYLEGEVTKSETTLNGQYYQNVPKENILLKCCCRHIYSYFCWCPKPAKVTNSEIITEKRPTKTSLKTTLLVRSNPFLVFFQNEGYNVMNSTETFYYKNVLSDQDRIVLGRNNQGRCVKKKL